MSTSARAPRTGKLARSAIAGLATARVGMANARQRVRHRLNAPASGAALAPHEAEIGRILLAAMMQLRGTALKVAQVLSLDASFLPPGVRAELARATHQVQPLNRALVGRVFREAFGCEPEALFTSFEPTAFAAASLGQVHRATLADGRAVAVKVQYPGISATLDTDMALLQRALHSLGGGLLHLPDAGVVDRLLAELHRQLRAEVDYEQEATQQRWFQQHAHACHHPGVVVADIIDSHTRQTVLTQTLLPGLHLEAWLATQPSQAQRDQQGQAVFDWFMACALKAGRIHADMHPGNFLFLPDGRVGILDFGCTQVFPAEVVQALALTWRAWLEEPVSAATLLRGYQALGMVAPDLPLATFSAEVLPGVAPVLQWATEPFTQPLFDFSTKALPPTPEVLHQKNLANHMQHMPAELMSRDRAWLGLMHLLRRLGARVDTRSARSGLTQVSQTKELP